MATAKDRGFEPKGLPGWRVFRDDAAWTGSPDCVWFFSRPADVPYSFHANEATGDVEPVFNDWAHGPRRTARGAVAAAHAHAEWVVENTKGAV